MYLYNPVMKQLLGLEKSMQKLQETVCIFICSFNYIQGLSLAPSA